MSDASSFDANIVTTAVDSTGSTTVGIVQSNVTQTTTAEINVISGVVGAVTLEPQTEVDANVTTGGKGDKGDTGPTGPAVVRRAYYSPVESPNGVRVQFTAPTAFVAFGLAVYLNGLQERYITEDNTTQFTFSTAPISTDIIALEF